METRQLIHQKSTNAWKMLVMGDKDDFTSKLKLKAHPTNKRKGGRNRDGPKIKRSGGTLPWNRMEGGRKLTKKRKTTHGERACSRCAAQAAVWQPKTWLPPHSRLISPFPLPPRSLPTLPAAHASVLASNWASSDSKLAIRRWLHACSGAESTIPTGSGMDSISGLFLVWWIWSLSHLARFRTRIRCWTRSDAWA